MAWITPDTDTVKRRISGPEFDALRQAARAAGQNADTMTADCIARVVHKVRGYVAGNSRNVLGVPGTIPDELESAFGALWVYEFITRLPGLAKLLDDRRVSAMENAMAELRDASRGTLAVVAPETPADDQAGSPGVQLVSSRTNPATPAQTAGLL